MDKNTILALTSVPDYIQQIRKQGKRIVVAGGCFDILHNGHLRFLRNAKAEGDILMVLLESDAAIAQSKGKGRPVNSQQERAEMLSAFRDVDAVVLLPAFASDTDYDNVINTIKPAIIATTKGDPWRIHKERQAKFVGAQVVDVIELIQNKSTTAIATLLAKEL